MKSRLIDLYPIVSAVLMIATPAFAQTHVQTPLFGFLMHPTHCDQLMGSNLQQADYPKALSTTVTSLQEQGDTVREAFWHLREFCEIKQERWISHANRVRQEMR